MRRIITAYRHAQGWHNVLKNDQVQDPTLTSIGMMQAARSKGHRAEVVLCSPLTRTLQTASHMFPDTPIIALDCLIEYPFTDKANKRMSIVSLREVFPNINFNMLGHVNQKGVDPDEFLKRQFEEFKDKLSMFPYRNIAVVGHSTWIHSYILGKPSIPNVELPHCEPFVLEKYD